MKRLARIMKLERTAPVNPAHPPGWYSARESPEARDRQHQRHRLIGFALLASDVKLWPPGCTAETIQHHIDDAVRTFRQLPPGRFAADNAVAQFKINGGSPYFRDLLQTYGMH
jgi:hypothetical protein